MAQTLSRPSRPVLLAVLALYSLTACEGESSDALGPAPQAGASGSNTSGAGGSAGSNAKGGAGGAGGSVSQGGAGGSSGATAGTGGTTPEGGSSGTSGSAGASGASGGAGGIGGGGASGGIGGSSGGVGGASGGSAGSSGGGQGGAVSPGAPAITSAAAGDNQTAEVNTEVPIAPRVLITDSQGIPVPGVAVNFYVSVGGGQVTGEQAVTGADGTAAAQSWSLGPVPGANELTGEAPGLAPVLFKATGTASAQGSMEFLEGNNQYAKVNQAVSIPPAVVVKDGQGQPVAGQTVTFEVTAGGGSVQGAQAVSDGSGVARVGSWVLGPQAGTNALEAKLPGKPTLTFQATAVAASEPVLERVTLLQGLDSPWDIAFAPDGTLLFTERSGRLKALLPGQANSKQVMAPPSDLNPQSQSGLLGIALDADFAKNRTAYIYVSSNKSGKMDNRVRKIQIAADYGSVTELGDILTGIPWGSGGGHSGGRIRLGPDGFLYVTTGDNRSATVPQNLAGLGSKVLRITTDGQPAPGNPDLGPGTRPEIFAYGFRNPQGIAMRPGSNQVFLCEHGPNQDDEVTLLKPGGNGGWDPNDGQGNYNGYDGAKMTDTGKFPSALLPTHVVGDSQGMSGCAFLQGSAWKSFDGRLAIAMLAGRRLIVARPSSDGTKMEDVSNELNNIARLRGVTQGPDGDAYIVVDESAPNGQIWRVTPK